MSDVWRVVSSATPSAELLSLVGDNLVAASLLMQRGFDTVDKAAPFLDPNLYRPAPATSLYGLANAAAVIISTIEKGGSFLVWGDFDVDGQTSTALLVSSLRQLTDPSRVRYHIPNRATEGHGIFLPKLQELVSNPNTKPDCLITCDTGISDGEAVLYAKAMGIRVIITDHHDPDAELLEYVRYSGPNWVVEPDLQRTHGVMQADAIIDPKFQPPGDALATLPGVGVAYKLMEEVYRCVGRAGEERELLDLVALGIVADVAEQVHDTRYLLQLGLEKLRTTRRQGLLALMAVAGLSKDSIDSNSISFQLAPRMNALGRMDDATESVVLLTTDDPLLAGRIAARMERLNHERRLLTSQMASSALTMLERVPEYLDHKAIVLGHAGWHSGIVGIVAAQIVEQFRKPTVLLVLNEDGTARGSARSIGGVDIGASIAACHEALIKYGGHPGAAGVTLTQENVDRFRLMLDQAIEDHTDFDKERGQLVDAELSFDQLTLDTAEAVMLLAPFGQGNPEPLFITRSLRVRSDSRFGQQGTHRRLRVGKDDDGEIEVVWFQCGDRSLPPEPIDLLFALEINEYKGRSVQLRYVNSRRSVAEEQVMAPSLPQIHVVDLRQQHVDAATLPLPPDAVWYAEGLNLSEQDGDPIYSPRHAISDNPADTLVLWSSPPVPDLLDWMVETVQPQTLYLCARSASDDSLSSVVRHVAGMCKYAIEQDGIVHMDRMAARLATTESVIRYSLLWLDAKGTISIGPWQEGETLVVCRGSQQGDAVRIRQFEADLQVELSEVRAYKRFHQRAKLRSLGLPEEMQQART